MPQFRDRLAAAILFFTFTFARSFATVFADVTFATLHLSSLPRIFLYFSLCSTIMLASSHFSPSSETYVALFFLPSSLHPSCLATLPVDIRIRASQWCHREVKLQWREEDEAGTEVTRRCISLSAPPIDVLVRHLCDLTEAVSNSPGIMPRLRISTVSIRSFRLHLLHLLPSFIRCYVFFSATVQNLTHPQRLRSTSHSFIAC